MMAGRKQLPPHLRKVQRTVSIRPDTLAWLEARRGDNEAIGHVLDRLASTGTAIEVPAGARGRIDAEKGANDGD